MTDDRDEHQRGQDKALVVVLRAAQWNLDSVAHALGANRVSVDAWKELLTSLDNLRDLVSKRSGDSPVHRAAVMDEQVPPDTARSFEP